MAVQGFKGSRAIESEEAEYKGLVRGLLLGCALPSVMLCVFLWNTGVSTNIVSKDVGAPIEVMERMKAVEGLEPKAARKVFFRGANRTVVRDPKNPFNRGKVDNSLAQRRLRAFLNKTKQKSAPMPWDIREAMAGATAAIQYRAAPRRRSATGSFFAVVSTDRTPPGSASPRPAPRRAPHSLQPHQQASHAAPRRSERSTAPVPSRRGEPSTAPQIWAPVHRTATTRSRRRSPTASRTPTSWRTASVRRTSIF